MPELKEPVWKGKEILRRSLIKRRITLENREDKNKGILKNLIAMPIYQQAKVLFVYISTAEEADTRKLLKLAIREGKQVFAPVCKGASPNMEFHQITGEEQLKPGRYGILEPDPEICPSAVYDSAGRAGGKEGALCVVPGVSFDRQGNRLGYGKGYYDRFLVEHEIDTVGLCYEELLLPQLPGEEHDQRVMLVVTETEIYHCRPGKDGAYERKTQSKQGGSWRTQNHR